MGMNNPSPYPQGPHHCPVLTLTLTYFLPLTQDERKVEAAPNTDLWQHKQLNQ